MYFPNELFSIIKEYTGIVGMTERHIKLFNTVSIKQLKCLTEPYTKLGTFEKKTNAKEQRKIILRKLFFSTRPSNCFDTMLLLNQQLCKNKTHKLYEMVNIGDEIKISNRYAPVQIGRVIKNNKKSILFSEYKYYYEKRQLETRVVKIFNTTELLPPITINRNFENIDIHTQIGVSFVNENGNRHRVYEPDITDKYLIKNI